MIRLLAAALPATALALSCAPAPLTIPAGCSPLLFDHDCGLPYPNDFFLVDDKTLPSGKRIHFDDAAKLLTEHGDSADVNDTWPADGFSRVSPIVFTLGVRADQKSVSALFDDATATTKKGFKTALIDATTGERIPHFIDVDPLAEKDSRQALVMHPLVALKERTRYVVAISGVSKSGGGAITAPEAFARMRDANVGDDKVLAPLLKRYETDVFPIAVKAGLDRKALQLAWDFTTGSDAHVQQDMLEARAIGLAALDATPPVVHVDGVFEAPQLQQILSDGSADDTFRLVRGTITGPRVVDSDESGALLFRGADGHVALNGTTTFEFSALIPSNVATGTTPAMAIGFGHGFFGDRTEAEGVAVREIANNTGVIVIAIDWQGMSNADVGQVVANVGGDVSKSIEFADRLMQSMVNWTATTHAIKSGLFSADPAFQRAADDPNNPSAPFIDATKPIGFLGISLGHILGGTLSALDPDIERSVLMVGGAAFTTMFFRARPFDQFLGILKLTVPDPLDRQKLAAQMQTPFDRIDPSTFAPYVLNEELPSGPPGNHENRRVLQMMGIGDRQVPNVASELHARLMGLPLLTPAPGRAVFGLEQKPYPVDGSAFQIYDLGVDDSFYSDAEPQTDGNIIHEGVRRLAESQAQAKRFYADGTIIDPCNGACVIDVSGLNLPSD